MIYLLFYKKNNIMNASSLDSLLMNCVNHSNYNDKLKSRLREKCNRSIVLKKDYKDLRNKYNILHLCRFKTPTFRKHYKSTKV